MSNDKFKKFIIPKVITTLIFLVVSVLMVVTLIDAIQQINAGNNWAGLGFAIIIIYGGFALAFCLFISLICLIVAISKKKKGLASSGTVTYFILLTILPIVLYGAALLATQII